jgi:hypothetical protein
MLRLAQQGRIEEIMHGYPGKLLCYGATLTNVVGEERLKSLRTQANEGIWLKQENGSTYGDPGTDKSGLAREACGLRACLKSQNTWLDVLCRETAGRVRYHLHI